MPPVALQIRRWTRQEYERMAELGVFSPDERVQLLDGEIVTMTPQNSPHAAAIGKTERVLARVFGDAYWIRIQMPVVLDPDSEPEPDLAVVSGAPADYVQGASQNRPIDRRSGGEHYCFGSGTQRSLIRPRRHS